MLQTDGGTVQSVTVLDHAGGRLATLPVFAGELLRGTTAAHLALNVAACCHSPLWDPAPWSPHPLSTP